jgi:hypothetical protein
MDENQFEIYKLQLEAEGLDANTKASRDWFFDKMDEINGLDVNRNKIKTQMPVAATYFIGRMYMFFYKPKNILTLRYYDRFPLVIMLEVYKEGFLGLNLHYLPIDLRQRLYYNLLPRATTQLDNFGPKTRLKINYDYLQGKTFLKAYRPCIKRYRYSNMIGRVANVPANEWEVAVHLPTAYFRKATESKVHKESRIMARKPI